MTLELVARLRELLGKATPGPWYVGAQNDALFVIAGSSPSLNNDYPVHDAHRVVVCKPFDDKSELLTADAKVNAALIVETVNALPQLLAAIESRPDDELLAGLSDVIRWIRAKDPLATNFIYVQRAIDSLTPLFGKSSTGRLGRMSSDELIEKVARAIAECKGYDPDYPTGETRVQWECFTEVARAAIAAMQGDKP